MPKRSRKIRISSPSFQKHLAVYTALPYNQIAGFVEAPFFSRIVYDYLREEEYAAFQWALVLRPDAGDVIPGSGGLRKLRWGLEGRGKRGGLRVVYYWRAQAKEIWLLTIYAKNEAVDIDRSTLRAIRKEIEL